MQTRSSLWTRLQAPHNEHITDLGTVAVESIDTSLPDWMANAEESRFTPGLRLVQVLDEQGRPLRKMVFVGTNTETGDIYVAMHRANGRSSHVTLVPHERLYTPPVRKRLEE